MEWVNWSGSQRATPQQIAAPRSRHELAQLIATAPGPIRVAGAGHSFSAGAVTEGTLLRLDALDRVLDAEDGLVRVEAGIRLKALSRELYARGLAMPNLGDIDAQSLAGALATGTHGTGTKLPNLSGQVVSVELIGADGREHTVDGGDELRAARVSLGALGVIAAVTLRCVPAFRLRHTDKPEPLEAVLDELQERADAHDHFEFWTFPHAGVALTRTLDRTEDPPNRPGKTSAYVSDVVMDNHAFRALNEIAKRFPGTIPRLNRFASAVASQRERVDWSYAIFASERLVRFEEMEYGVPREHAVAAVRAARAALERHAVSFPIELRFTAADDALLSPAHGRDSAFVAMHVFQGMEYEPAFREVEAALSELGGRPHWGKRSFLDHTAFAARYPRWEDFQRIRADFDPEGRFANAWLRDVLG
ncbi:FAD-binding protein [Solirubrobacter ginsenosidimutans]|uniref:FAD-binding protein n=1 Tax=Solirubrobacter ginsenosidimutans TaxID=490573 RepID=A0A9X3N136_9ACTN|nr:D-arabinono-1,4-lactone oxidase [Solirubrobacter ginsenosidimutans]MDA0165386.1 FAD-binding protein [Solirubrobacter ginsenosidimutans]